MLRKAIMRKCAFADSSNLALTAFLLSSTYYTLSTAKLCTKLSMHIAVDFPLSRKFVRRAHEHWMPWFGRRRRCACRTWNYMRLSLSRSTRVITVSTNYVCWLLLPSSQRVFNVFIRRSLHFGPTKRQTAICHPCVMRKKNDWLGK